MKELMGDIFEQLQTADAICVPTNCGVITDDQGNNPENPMGALAGQFATRWPEVPFIYGRLLLRTPNVPVILGYVEKDDPSVLVEEMQDETDYTVLVAFPTMRDIGVPADLWLVDRSIELLVEMTDVFGWNTVVVPRAGCGIGGLSWDDEVKPLMKQRFDDRFICCHFEPKRTRGFIKFGDEEENGQEDCL